MKNKLQNEKFIRAIPKTDLHVHLDGSVRISTLIELAGEKKISLPSYSEEGLRELVFKSQYENLPEYLEGFRYTNAVLQDAGALERVAREVAEDNLAEGVRYLEVRFAPQLHVNSSLSLEEALQSVNRGLKAVEDEFNAGAAVKSGAEPPFHYGIIVCAMRMFGEDLSCYFRQFAGVHRYTKGKMLYSIASLELARAAVLIRDEHDLPIVGFDLAGPESGYPAVDHNDAYQFAHKNFLKKTVHAGEDYGPESIFQAITDLHADRIGHGYHLFEANMIKNPAIRDKNQYMETLAEYIADRRITFEICLTSNYQTISYLDSISDHTFRKMLDKRLSMTLCTDNRTVSNTTVSDEIILAVKSFDITAKQLRDLVIYGFKRSFFPGTYLEKRIYVRKVIDYYEEIEHRYGINM